MDATPNEEDLRRTLDSLLTMARDNEEKQRRLNEFELKLIASDSLRTLMEHLFRELPSSFALEYVNLTLLDPEGDLARLVQEAQLEPEMVNAIQFVSSGEPLAFFGDDPKPWLGPFSPGDHAILFAEREPWPASVALLPLVRHGELIGSLNLGSLDAQRYESEGNADFLARLAAITAISVENCANNERLRQLGLTDAITGVNNRRYFEERLAEEFAAAMRKGTTLACIFLDVDSFKQFNDLYGHQIGDQALHEVARVLRMQVRRSDTVSRYGGEEFVVLLPGVSEEQARDSAERIRQAVANNRFRTEKYGKLQVTLSAGIAVLPPEGRRPPTITPATLLRDADQALYAAKARGRNCVVVSPQEPFIPPW